MLKILGLTLLSIMVGCSTSKGTKYLPEYQGEGYSEIKNSKYFISSFKGNSYTHPELALFFSRFRALEICKELGQDIVINMQTEDLTKKKEVLQSSSYSYQAPVNFLGNVNSTYNAFSKTLNSNYSGTINGGSVVQTGSSWVENLFYPVYNTYFTCSNDYYSLDVGTKEFKPEEVRHIVPDLMGAVQVVETESINLEGLQVGDLILKANNIRIKDFKDLVIIMQESKKKIVLSVIRNGSPKEVTEYLKDKTIEEKQKQEEIRERACLLDELKDRDICEKNPQEKTASKNIEDLRKKEYQKYGNQTRNDNDWQFGIGASLITSSQLKGTATLETPSNKIVSSMEGDIPNHLSLSIDLRKLPNKKIGFISSFNFNPTYEDKKNQLELNSFIGKANLAYRNEVVYVFGGINLSGHSMDRTDTPPVGVSREFYAEGGLGLQGGFGFAITGNLSIEMEYESIRCNIQEEIKVSGQKTTLETDSFLNNLKIGLKVLF